MKTKMHPEDVRANRRNDSTLYEFKDCPDCNGLIVIVNGKSNGCQRCEYRKIDNAVMQQVAGELVAADIVASRKTISFMTDSAYGQADLGTHVIIDGGEAIEYGRSSTAWWDSIEPIEF